MTFNINNIFFIYLVKSNVSFVGTYIVKSLCNLVFTDIYCERLKLFKAVAMAISSDIQFIY